MEKISRQRTTPVAAHLAGYVIAAKTLIGLVAMNLPDTLCS